MKKSTAGIWAFVYSFILLFMYASWIFDDAEPTNTELMGFILIATAFLMFKIDANK